MKDNLEHGWLVGGRPQSAEEYKTCGWCGAKIYYGDDYYDICGETVCEDCIIDCRRTAD